MPRRRTCLLVLLVLAVGYVYYRVSTFTPAPRTLVNKPRPTPAGRVFSDPPYKAGIPDKYYHTANTTERAKAAIVILSRNRNLQGVISSMKQLEARFNAKYGYPYVFLNEVPFTDEFTREVTALTAAPVHFGLIPHDHWFQPDWIDEERASQARERMAKHKVMYGDSVPYRNMCRFQSGFFFRHPLLAPYKYYWRVEPDVQFHCDIDFDPFLFMHGEDKKYAFAVALPEHKRTVRTLWRSVQEFMKRHPELVARDNALDMLVSRTKVGEFWNLCHFWSNFEIADLDLWRSDAYLQFFDFLDKKGGFYYERWGDAPVHTFGAALFAKRHQIHFFTEIGYFHIPFTNCPAGDAHTRGQCTCRTEDSFEQHGWSCLRPYDELFTGKTVNFGNVNKTVTSGGVGAT